MSTVNVQDPIYQVLWEHSLRTGDQDGTACRCGAELSSRPAHWQHIADSLRADRPTVEQIAELLAGRS